MSRKLVLFMHTSLDGFVAGVNGEMDWICVDEELFDFAGERTSQADTALYGRVTYDMMESYWPTAAEQPGATRHDVDHSRWYKSVHKVVLSRSMKGRSLPNTTIISDNLAAEVAALKDQPGKEIIIFGSPGAAHALMQHDLIDEYWLFVNPVLLGQGIPVFARLNQKQSLRQIAHTGLASGVVCVHYERDRA